MMSWIVADFSDPRICLALAVLAFTAFVGVELRHSDHWEAAGCRQVSSHARAAHALVFLVALITFTC